MARTLWTLFILSIALALAGLTLRGLSVRASDSGPREWAFAPPHAVDKAPSWSDRPPDGPVTEYYENGIRRFDGFLSAGVPDGPWRYWWENGQLRWRGTYDQGRLDGYTESYHENGQLEFQASYRKGQLHGAIEKRDDRGCLVQTGAYVNGRKRGAFVFYDPDGRIDIERSGLYDGEERIGDLPPERLAAQRVARKRARLGVDQQR